MAVEYYRPAKADPRMLQEYVKGIATAKVVSNGPLCRELETTIRDYHNATYACCCSNCTTGLVLALNALRKLTGAERALIPSFTWSSTEYAVKAAGLRPAYVDVDLDRWLMNPCGTDTDIVVPVSTFGAWIEPEYKGTVLVDAAHAMGTAFKLEGVAGAIFSLAPSKILTAGEGGILITHDLSFATEFSALRDKFARMSELNAAMALSHWGGMDAYLRDRRVRYLRYQEILKTGQKVSRTNYSTAAFRVKHRDALAEKLTEKGIETRVYYKPLMAGLQNTDRLFADVICLPNWYGCPTDEVLKALKESI